MNSDIETAKSVKPLTNEDGKNYYPITVNGVQYHDKEQAGEAIREAIHNNKDIMEGKERIIGSYRGFQISAFADSLQMNAKMRVNLKCACDHYGDLNMDENVKASGNITRLDNIVNGIGLELQNAEDKLVNICADIEESVAAAEAVFPQEQELTEKESRLAEVNTLLANSDVSDSSDDTEMRGENIIDELDEDMEAEKETNSWER